jgi:hypothetical protein
VLWPSISAACIAARFQHVSACRIQGSHETKNRRRSGAPSECDASLDIDDRIVDLALRNELVVQLMMDKCIRVH